MTVWEDLSNWSLMASPGTSDVGRRTSWVPLRCVGLTGEREDDLAG